MVNIFVFPVSLLRMNAMPIEIEFWATIEDVLEWNERSHCGISLLGWLHDRWPVEA
jgi:hypothetical protein